tara:strand:- start:1124 stop:1498 length:375 start_codon:yes stop_codon:yes gene_type:complete
MNLDELEKKLNNCNKSLKNDTSIQDISKDLLENESEMNLNDKENIKNTYYETYPKNEREYQIMNDKYKKWISQYSKAYIEMSEHYVGEELPRNHESTYLDSGKDIKDLYNLFGIYAMAIFLNVV